MGDTDCRAEAALLLPVELWSNVFEHLKPGCTGPIRDSEEAIGADPAELSCFHQLKLVCKSFNQTFARHAQLHSHLILNRSNSSRRLTSLLLWLQRYAGSVTKFTACCDSLSTETVLGALSGAAAKLTNVHMACTRTATMQALSACSNITVCALDCPFEDRLDLTPLTHLLQLQELLLQNGNFSNVPLSSNLTFLRLECSDASFGICSPYSRNLYNMEVRSSCMSGLYDKGVCDCTALQRLALIDSSITGATAGDSFVLRRDRQMQIPVDLLVLTQLCDLHVSFPRAFDANRVQVSADLDWLCKLTSLKSLNVVAEGPVTFSHAFHHLQNLEYLSVSAANEPAASFELDWEAMIALKHVDLFGTVSLSHTFEKMSALQHLTHLSLWGLQPGDSATAINLASLAYRLAAARPDVEFVLEDMSFRSVVCAN